LKYSTFLFCDGSLNNKSFSTNVFKALLAVVGATFTCCAASTAVMFGILNVNKYIYLSVGLLHWDIPSSANLFALSNKLFNFLDIRPDASMKNSIQLYQFGLSPRVLFNR